MKRIYINRGWVFTEKFFNEQIDNPIKDGENIVLPHSCKETSYNYINTQDYQMVSCYQKLFKADSAWASKQVSLTFEGVGHKADVYLNGKHLACHKCGYTAFSINISNHLFYEHENLLVVRVDSRESLNQPPFGHVIDYTTYGGIYREAYLEIKNPVNISNIFVKPEVEDISTEGMSAEEITEFRTDAILETELILSEEGKAALRDGELKINQYLNGNKVLDNVPLTNTSISTKVYNISLWDIESPKLYTAITQLILNNEVMDENKTKIGFRSSKFLEKGYFLNGRKLKIRGLNRHQCYPYVGYAMPERAQREDAKILKNELGLNAVRTSHYPQSQYFIDECDKLDLLVS